MHPHVLLVNSRQVRRDPPGGKKPSSLSIVAETHVAHLPVFLFFSTRLDPFEAVNPTSSYLIRVSENRISTNRPRWRRGRQAGRQASTFSITFFYIRRRG